jgi:hypothetical protein
MKFMKAKRPNPIWNRPLYFLPKTHSHPIPSLKTVVRMMYESSWGWIHDTKVSM